LEEVVAFRLAERYQADYSVAVFGSKMHLIQKEVLL
jgi:hypothetical protein